MRSRWCINSVLVDQQRQVPISSDEEMIYNIHHVHIHLRAIIGGMLLWRVEIKVDSLVYSCIYEVGKYNMK